MNATIAEQDNGFTVSDYPTGTIRVWVEEQLNRPFRWKLEFQIFAVPKFTHLYGSEITWTEPHEIKERQSDYTITKRMAKRKAKRMLKKWRAMEARGGLKTFAVYEE